MNEWELKAETQELGADDSAAFQKAKQDYFVAEKIYSQSLKQKSRLKWAIDGDENSRFFQGVVRGRLKKNSIHDLSINGN